MARSIGSLPRHAGRLRGEDAVCSRAEACGGHTGSQIPIICEGALVLLDEARRLFHVKRIHRLLSRGRVLVSIAMPRQPRARVASFIR